MGRIATAALLVVALALGPTRAGAEPVAVRFVEGVSHGFLILRSPRGDVLAHGELVQTPRADRVDIRLLLRFANGSLYDEKVTYSQHRVFRVLAYHHLQNGPSFPEASDVSFDRETGRYRASVGDQRAEGTLDIPEDLHNGITSLLLRHLPAGGSAAGHLAYFGPKPRMLKTTLRPEGTDKYSGAGPGTATRYLLKVEIGGVTGVVADLVGKGPPDVRYWITRGEAPAFARFEGAMFVKGPVWRIEIAAPRWP